MAKVPARTYDNFEKLTGYSLRTNFLQRFARFVTTHRQNVVDYYGGKTKKPFAPSFTELDYLSNQSSIVKGHMEANKGSLANTENWELLELLSDIHIGIKTIEESSRWLRSSITKGNFNPSTNVDVTLMMLQTLEQVSSDVIGSNDSQNRWVQLAIDNNLTEEDYSPNGGNLLKVAFANSKSINISSIVDNIDSNEKVKGLDILKKYNFVDDDLEVLGYTKTFEQTVDVLASLKQGDHPGFPQLGINKSVAIGSTRNFVSYPILTRNFYEAFSTDDTIRRFKITNMEMKHTSLSIEMEFQDRTGEVVTTFSAI